MSYLIEYFEDIPVILEPDIAYFSIHEDVKELKVLETKEKKNQEYYPTSAHDSNETLSIEVKEKIATLKEVIAAITKSFSNTFEEIKSGISEVEIEISLGFEKELKMWILGAKGTFSTKIKIVWKRTALNHSI
ncbi:hypothetical protein GCM10011514_35800 [Emticicia aquatilis]|uniref:Trypsin-co-occurring domain-containing protein n=1 Tax=Emticicia aquatilis TaxID=1537369 RepID=A0A916YZJ8_9BACT|nr:CU044_2847 family protein [Emticicia aquatilis]GGD68526.1 hypothetical protein GCM10011514_35800 [Emticicia aquatilis]